MKRIFVFLAGALMLTSCFSDMKNQISYTLQANFDYTIPETQLQDSLFTIQAVEENFLTAAGWKDLAFFYNFDKNSAQITGGFRPSFACDSTGFDKIDETTEVKKYWSVYSKKGIYTPFLNDKEGKPVNGFLLFYDNPLPETMPKHDVVFINTAYGNCIMSGCYVNNTAQTVKAVKTTFKEGDYIKVIATGVLGEKETAKAEIYLAQYNEEKSFVMKDWTLFDLKALGDVDFIDFEVETNREDIQPYFCMDLLEASVTLNY